MWLSKDVVGFFQISHEHVRELQVNLGKAQTENEMLRHENSTLKTHFDWLRTKVNSLEAERAGLIEKAYNIRLPVPEIARAHQPIDPNEFSFEDLGDDIAKRLGLPVFEHSASSPTQV